MWHRFNPNPRGSGGIKNPLLCQNPAFHAGYTVGKVGDFLFYSSPKCSANRNLTYVGHVRFSPHQSCTVRRGTPACFAKEV